MRGTDITSRERSTQRGPVSMAIFDIGITPLINMLIVILSNEYSANVMVYANDFSASRNLQDLRRWLNALTEIGPKFGHYFEAIKTWLVFKPCASEKVESVFFGSKIKITMEVRRYLRGLVGT